MVEYMTKEKGMQAHNVRGIDGRDKTIFTKGSDG